MSKVVISCAITGAHLSGAIDSSEAPNNALSRGAMVGSAAHGRSGTHFYLRCAGRLRCTR